jgi:hypothetical protein
MTVDESNYIRRMHTFRAAAEDLYDSMHNQKLFHKTGLIMEIEMDITRIIWKILISIFILASVSLIVRNRPSHVVKPKTRGWSIRINQSSPNDDLALASNHPVSEKILVGLTKSNKYHYPSCGAARRIKTEDEIWFSCSADAKAHGYVPCKLCNPL